MQKLVKAHAGLSNAKHELDRLASRTTTVQIAADTGIHQSQVSRLLRGQFERVSPNVRVLLNYAKRPKTYTTPQRRNVAAKTAVVKAALRTWDTTPAGARALVKLLRSVEEIRRGRRSN
jgi:hypothetical protein